MFRILALTSPRRSSPTPPSRSQITWAAKIRSELVVSVIVVELQFAANHAASLARNRQGMDLAESANNPALFIFARRADTHVSAPPISESVEIGSFFELPSDSMSDCWT